MADPGSTHVVAVWWAMNLLVLCMPDVESYDDSIEESDSSSNGNSGTDFDVDLAGSVPQVPARDGQPGPCKQSASIDFKN